MESNLFLRVTTAIRELIFSPTFLEYARNKPSDFTRNRTMPFTDLVIFMINLIKCSTHTALKRFFKIVKGSNMKMKQQSFSEARCKLRWEACRMLMDHAVEKIYGDPYKKWNGYRLLAVDGSKQQLPADKQLKEIYGSAGRGGIAVTGQSSVLYDMLNNIIVDARLEPLAVDERTLAEMHIKHLRSMSSFHKELAIFDRGYASFELIKGLVSGLKMLYYVMRCRTKFNVEIDDLPLGDHEFTLKRNDEEIGIRVIKFTLDTGEIETLLTNIDDELSPEEFKQLYFMRWPVETKFGELKYKLEIENFSCRTQNNILQDFYINTFLSNMLSLAINQAQDIADDERKDKENMYDYKINVNEAVGEFKDEFVSALLIKNRWKRSRACTKIIYELAESVIPIRPERHNPRNPTPSKAKYRHNRKSNC